MKDEKFKYYFKRIHFHPLIDRYIECRLKNGKAEWMVIYKDYYCCNSYYLGNKDKARKEIEFIKKQYDWLLK